MNPKVIELLGAHPNSYPVFLKVEGEKEWSGQTLTILPQGGFADFWKFNLKVADVMDSSFSGYELIFSLPDEDFEWAMNFAAEEWEWCSVFLANIKEACFKFIQFVQRIFEKRYELKNS